MIIYGSKIWVFMDLMMKVLEVFHHNIAIRIAGMMVRRGVDGEWEWALVEAVLEAAGICLMRCYVQRHQTTTAEYVMDIPIY